MKLVEFAHIIIVIIVLAFSITLTKLSPKTLGISALFLAIIFFVNIGAKKLAALYFQADIETKIWQIQRWGLYERSHLKYPIPMGIILPFLISIISLGSLFWLASIQTEITAKKEKVVKRHDYYSFSEMTEFQIGVIPAMGIIACFLLAIIAYFAGFGELSKLAIFFACFNMLPIGQLDGTKIFFGSVIWWFILAVICVIGLAYALFLV